MSTKNFFAAALVTGSMFIAGAASGAASPVTLNPMAANGGLGVLSATDAAFQAVGFQSNLTASLVISGNAGVQTFSETGQLDITQFSNPGPVASGVFTNYRILGNFTLTGSGSWAGNVYTATPGTVSLALTLVGDPGALGCATQHHVLPKAEVLRHFGANPAAHQR